ncbi:hypothetical protein KP509_04G051800 [Ceratopteris richardii]|nr:hypothetical protein KP509_04G051800 [Ceratopteris richardii]
MEEKKAFLRSLKSGELSHMVKPWEPWWLHPSASKMSLSVDGTRVVQPLENADMDESNLSDIPLPLDAPLPPLRNLTAKPPSPLLIVHFVEILYTYCFILRFYNGDWTSDTFHAAWTCLSVSHVLGSSASPETVTEALNECFITICSPNFKSAGGVNFAISLLDDVIALLHIGRPGVIFALSDLHHMLEKAVADCKLRGPNAALKKRNKKSSLASGVFTSKTSGSSELKAVCKKVFFLLCWANEQPLEIFTAQASIVESEKARLLEIQNARTSDTNKINTKKHSIEELAEDTH